MNRNTPFYIAQAVGAKLADISSDRIASFIERVKQERGYSFSGGTTVESVLKQLVLKDGNHLLNAALMLFGKNPQQFCPSAVVKCTHYHGTEVSRPIPSHQIFGATLFEQVDAAVDFVLSKLNRTVGGREQSPVADVRMEIPIEAIAEIVVNAVVHRDYDSNGSVQIAVFADRVEIANPGRLPDELTVDDLARRHVSVPVNPFLARPFFLAGYINQLGYGTREVVERCRKARLPAPQFEQLTHQFRVTIWRDWLSDQILAELNLNSRQILAIRTIKTKGRMTNALYQEVTGASRATAIRDLESLVRSGVFERRGERRGSHYLLSRRMTQI